MRCIVVNYSKASISNTTSDAFNVAIITRFTHVVSLYRSKVPKFNGLCVDRALDRFLGCS